MSRLGSHERFDQPRRLPRELGLAWQRLSLYQEGHPARREVMTRAHALLTALTAARGNLAIGVTRDGFVGRDEKVDGGSSGWPWARV